MFAIPHHLSHLSWPEFGNEVCYLFDTGSWEPKFDCKIYAIRRDHNGNDGEHCIVSSAPIRVWCNNSSNDYWFRHTLIDDDHMIVLDYNGLTVWDRTLNPIFNQPTTEEMKIENNVYGYTYREGILSYWVINRNLHDGEYHDPSVAQDGQLHNMDLGIG